MNTLKLFLLCAGLCATAYTQPTPSTQTKQPRGSQKHFERFARTGQCYGCDLRDFDLREVIKNLNTSKSKITLNCSNLEGANLAGTSLKSAYLVFTDLTGANLSKADLQGADLSKADLQGANLQNAYLRNASLFNTNLYKANLSGANLYNTNFAFSVLTGALALKTCFSFARNVTQEQLDSLDKRSSTSYTQFFKQFARKCVGW